MKIQAAVLTGVDEPLRIETVDLAEPREGEVLVKIAAAGICRSDWHLVTGATSHPLPVVPGHEGAGRVQATGPGVDGLTVDDLVTLARQEKIVMGCYYGSTVPARDFPLYGQYYLDGKLDLARMISKTYALPQINEAYQDMLAARIARGMIVFD